MATTSPSIKLISGSDGSGNASLATITNTRSPGSSTIQVDTVDAINTNFYGSMGTPHTFVDPITSETITVISEATAVDFEGHVDGANLEIDAISPGYADAGSAVGDIVIIRPITEYANNIANVLNVSHNDDGTLKQSAVLEPLDADRGVAGAIHNYVGSTTWTKPAGLKYVIVEVQAGGGGGGGAATAAGGASACGLGGASGGYGMKKILAADLAATVAVTVGAAGTAGTAGNNAGGNGGASSFGAHVTTGGGDGGAGGSSSATVGSTSNTNSGGTATGGDINIVGQVGGGKYRGAATDCWGGRGATSRWGAGAPEAAAGNAGIAANGYGAGGSGGNTSNGGGSKAGGAGSAGIVIVKEYY